MDRKFERGPLSLRVVTDRSEMTIAERLKLALEITCGQDYEAELPRFGEKLEQFGIVDYETSRPELVEGNRLCLRRTYVLEPFLSGDYRIPPMKVVFSKKGAQVADKHELETEEIVVKVKSLLPKDVAGLKINDIAPPVELPCSRGPWLWAAAGGGACVLIAAAVLVSRRRRGRGGIAPAAALPAHEVAYAALRELVAEDLVGKGLLKQFYQRMSSILRGYIEQRFGLHAPERTTEEFLEELRHDDTLDPSHKELLRDFLRHCDVVKFAEHHPSGEEVGRAFDSCRRFIAETAQQAAVGAEAAQGAPGPGDGGAGRAL